MNLALKIGLVLIGASLMVLIVKDCECKTNKLCLDIQAVTLFISQYARGLKSNLLWNSTTHECTKFSKYKSAFVEESAVLMSSTESLPITRTSHHFMTHINYHPVLFKPSTFVSRNHRIQLNFYHSDVVGSYRAFLRIKRLGIIEKRTRLRNPDMNAIFPNKAMAAPKIRLKRTPIRLVNLNFHGPQHQAILLQSHPTQNLNTQPTLLIPAITLPIRPIFQQGSPHANPFSNVITNQMTASRQPFQVSEITTNEHEQQHNLNQELPTTSISMPESEQITEQPPTSSSISPKNILSKIIPTNKPKNTPSFVIKTGNKPQISVHTLIPELRNSGGKTYIHGESIVQRNGNDIHIHHINVDPKMINQTQTQTNNTFSQVQSSSSEEIPIHVLLGLKDGSGLKEINVNDLNGDLAHIPNLNTDNHHHSKPPLKTIVGVSAANVKPQTTFRPSSHTVPSPGK